MPRTKKRSKKTPQANRKSTRDRKRSEKGQYFDEHMLDVTDNTDIITNKENTDAPTVAVPEEAEVMLEDNSINANGNVSNENLSQSTPCTIYADTPRRKSEGRSEGVDLQTLLSVSEVVDNVVEKVALNHFPESVVEVDTNYVREIKFGREQQQDDEAWNEEWATDYQSWKILSNVYDLLHYGGVTEQNTEVNSNSDTTELEKAIDEHVNTINKLLQKQDTHELLIEDLKKKLFNKDQQLKIMSDKVNQLQNTNAYRKEVVRLEGLVEEGELKVRRMREEMSSKVNKIEVLEEKQKEMKELERCLEQKKMEELQEKDRQMKGMEENLSMQVEKIKELEWKYEEGLKIQEDHQNNQEKIKILEENQTHLMNENTILKNEAKVKENNRRRYMEENEKRPLTRAEKKESEQVTSTSDNREVPRIKEELNNLKGELKRFKDFTFKKLDMLTGKDSSTSSLSTENGSENESSPDISLRTSQKKKTPPQRKKWDLKDNQGRIHPWVLRYESNNPQTAEESPDQNGRTIPLVPGPKSYRDAVRSNSAPPACTDFSVEEKAQKINGYRLRRAARESKTLIVSSSITRDINKHSFNRECKNTNVSFQEFKGKKAKDIVRYMVPHLEDENPSSVVFIAGGNDLPNKDIPMDEVKEVANCLIEAGVRCRTHYGVENVYISSIMPRSNSEFQGNRHRLNKLLKVSCRENNFTFINNDNIVLKPHVHYDEVHLNDDGSRLLRENLLSVLNS